MKRKIFLWPGILILIAMPFFLFLLPSSAQTTPICKISVFNFGAINIEAAPYGTMVTNMLMQELEKEPRFAIVDRRTLEAFLNLNDLQQRDDLANIIHIGSRLGLDYIVSGNIEKRGVSILVNCRLTSIAEGRAIFSTQLRVPGDPQLDREVRNLSRRIVATISDFASRPVPEVAKKPLAAPINIKTRPGGKRVSLTWENPPGVTAAGYELFRGTSSDGPFARIGATDRPEYTDHDLERETTYYYRIRAFDEKGQQSPWSNIVAARTALTPNPPVIIRTTSLIKAISITWSPSAIPSKDPAKLKGYKLYRAKEAGGPYKEVATVLGRDLGLGVDVTATLDKLMQVSYVDRGLVDGEEFFYSVTAYNELNLESEFSAPVKGTSIAAPAGLTAQGGLIREVILNWEHIDSPAIKGYFLYRSLSEKGGFTKIKRIDPPAPKQLVNYTDRENLADNVTYYYQVTAYDEAGQETAASKTVMATTRGKPPTPQAFIARSGLLKRVDLSWQANQETEVEGYMIYMSRTREGKYRLLKKIEGRTNNSFSHGGTFDKLEDGSDYFYILTTFNRVGLESDPTPPAAAKTKPRPTKPVGLTGTSLLVQEAALKWQPNPEADVTFYRIFRRESTEEGFTQVARQQGSTFLDKRLKDGTTYVYRIQAEDQDELLSDFSDTVTVRTKPRPRKVMGLAAELLPGRVELRWHPSPEPDIVHYVIYVKRFLGMDRVGTSPTATFSDVPPEKGRSKTYVVTAVDKDGLESEVSDDLRLVGR